MKKFNIFIAMISILLIISNYKVYAAANKPIKTVSANATINKNHSTDTDSDSDNGSSSGSDSGGILSGITDIPRKIGETLMDIFVSPIKDWFGDDIKSKVDEMNFYISSFKDMLTKEDLNSSMFSFTKLLCERLKPIGYSLVVLFFIISFYKKVIYFEIMDQLSIYKSLIRLVFAKMIVDNSYELLALIIRANKDIIEVIFDTLNYSNKMAIVKYINKATTTDIVQCVLNGFTTSWFLLLLLFCLIICMVMVVLRQLELAILTALSPLFFATFAGESTTDVFKAYLKNFVSVTVQTVWIACGVAFLMSSYISSVNIGDSGGLLQGGNCIVGFLALAIYVIQAPSSVKNAIGGTGGSGIPVGQLLMTASRII